MPLSVNTLKKELLAYAPNANVDLIEKAYNKAKEAHEGQKRATGEPYFIHVYEVARLLGEIRMSSTTIAAALLHDVVEDTEMTLEDVKNGFGNEVAAIVESVTKIKKIHFESKEHYTAENLRKIILATSKDIRVMLLKLADRLHNMRSLDALSTERQERIARETLMIYAPIAQKIGMHRWAAELEDLSMKYLYPEAYSFLREKISEKKTVRDKKTREIIKSIKDRIKESKIKGEVYGRAKHFYSIFRKMQKRRVDFTEIFDLIAIRVVVRTIPDCYTVLGLIHDLYHPIPGRVKDYISIPKANGYQSIHTTVVGKHGKILEVQIRTEKMHQYAEDGVAAHWRYSGNERDKIFDRKIAWLKQLIEWTNNYQDPLNFIEDFKFDLFENEIVVFTPKGDNVSLPEGATPIDFAYSIHTNVGNSCTGCTINGKQAPLDQRLKSGDIIEIQTSKTSVPSRQWLKFAKTNIARNRIRSRLGIQAETEQQPKKRDVSLIEADVIKKLVIDGKKGIKLSRCCNPQPGDSIKAYKSKGGRITIHHSKCLNASALDRDSEVPVSWRDDNSNSIDLVIQVKDRVGMLAELLNVIAKQKIPLTRIKFKQAKDRVNITAKLKTSSGYNKREAFGVLKKLDGVLQVYEKG